MWTLSFWRQAAERAGKTLAQALLSVWTLGPVLDLFAIDWRAVLGVAGGAALLSVLTSIVSLPIGDPGTPSIVSTPGRHAKGDDQ